MNKLSERIRILESDYEAENPDEYVQLHTEVGKLEEIAKAAKRLIRQYTPYEHNTWTCLHCGRSDQAPHFSGCPWESLEIILEHYLSEK